MPASTQAARDVPGTRSQRHPTIAGGGHFLQEDRPAELADVILDVGARTS